MPEFVTTKDLPRHGITFTRAWINRLVKKGKFPKPLRIGERCVVWVKSDIDAYMRSLNPDRQTQ